MSQHDPSGKGQPEQSGERWNMGWDGKPIEPAPGTDAARDAPAPEAPAASQTLSQTAGQTPPKTEGQTGPGAAPRAATGAATGDADTPSKAAPASPASPASFDGFGLGPLLRSEYSASAPKGTAPATTPPTLASRLFRVLAFFPLLPLALILAAQVIFSFDARPLWFPVEFSLADLFDSFGTDPNHWALMADGVPQTAFPLYFRLLYGLTQGLAQGLPQALDLLAGPDTIPGLASPTSFLFFAGAVSGLLLLLASYALFRLVARLDGRGALAAGILLLGSCAVTGLLHLVGMELFFAALVTMSHIFLYHAWVRRRAWICMTLGFLFAAAATLTMGPLGLLLPLVSGLFFILWTGRLTRLFRLDFLLGLVVGLGIPAAWVFLVTRETGQSMDGIFVQSLLLEQKSSWLAWEYLALTWYDALLNTARLWLPWTLLLLFLPWGRLPRKTTFAAVAASRKPALSGIGYMWCLLLGSLTVLSLMSVKPPLYALCVLPALAALFGRSVLRASPRASTAMKALFAALLALLGLLLIVAPLLPPSVTQHILCLRDLPALPQHLYFAGGVALFCALVLAFLVKGRRSEGFLLVMALFTALFAYPFWTLSVPTMDAAVRAWVETLPAEHGIPVMPAPGMETPESDGGPLLPEETDSAPSGDIDVPGPGQEPDGEHGTPSEAPEGFPEEPIAPLPVENQPEAETVPEAMPEAPAEPEEAQEPESVPDLPGPDSAPEPAPEPIALR